MKISLTKVDKIIEHLAIAPLLRVLANYTYFVSYTTQDRALHKKNNRSFIF